ncbi:hypothetical protein ACKLNR_003298 [Fusarium oxysporum f. sp. zingiberi]
MNIVAHSYDVRTSNSSALISYRGPRGRFMLDLKRKIQLKGLTRHYQPLQLKRYFGHKLCATEKSGELRIDSFGHGDYSNPVIDLKSDTESDPASLKR